MKIYTQEELTRKLAKKKARKTIYKVITYPIIILFILCNVIIIMQRVQNKEYMEILEYQAYKVSSGSMEPTIKIGDIIITKRIEDQEPKINDIITFKENEIIITHRVVNIKYEDNNIYYQTKGDNNNAVDDEWVNKENVIGIYQFKIEHIGMFITYLQTGTGTIALIVVVYIIYKIIGKRDDKKFARHEKRIEIEKQKNNN